jgi:hypothetical protein
MGLASEAYQLVSSEEFEVQLVLSVDAQAPVG